MAQCINDIEKQNIRLVEVLDQVHNTSRDIKLSSEYSEVKIRKALGKTPENNPGGMFLLDDAM